MRNTVIAVGLFVCTLGILGTVNVSASEIQLASIAQRQDSSEYSDSVAAVLSPVLDKEKPRPQLATTSPKQSKYVVKRGDSLSKIAQKYNTTWRRLYDKNRSITDPNVIVVGQAVVIPHPNEKLAPRKLPATQQPAARTQPSTSRSRPTASSTTMTYRSARVPRGSSAGNSYYAGYCTWYAKSRRPDMPNNLGNADTWVVRAAAQGLATGSRPRAGAIGQQGMHVVYVERVNRNGTVTISEMNYRGFGVVSSRTVPASTFMYIY